MKSPARSSVIVQFKRTAELAIAKVLKPPKRPEAGVGSVIRATVDIVPSGRRVNTPVKDAFARNATVPSS